MLGMAIIGARDCELSAQLAALYRHATVLFLEPSDTNSVSLMCRSGYPAIGADDQIRYVYSLFPATAEADLTTPSWVAFG